MVRTCALALLVAALGIGVPLHSHTHHDVDLTRVSVPGHGHGLVLVQHEMRLEPADAPTLAVVATSGVLDIQPAMRTVIDLPHADREIQESRAPPNTGPRAPPA